jgi:ABC-type sugar transport system permease subunit
MAEQAQVSGSQGPAISVTGNVLSYLLKLAFLAVLDAAAVWFLYTLLRDGVWPLAIPIVLIVLLINYFLLRPRAAPLRWQIPALSLIILIILFPIVYTVYSAFTNYSDGHILSKQQAIRRLSSDVFLPETGSAFSWTAYRSSDGQFVLWLVDTQGNGQLAYPSALSEQAAPDVGDIGELDENGIPVSIAGYTRLNRIEVVRYLNDLSPLEFETDTGLVRVRNLDEVAGMVQLYVYDPEQDAITDQQTGIVYAANSRTGFFTAEDGTELIPGYTVNIGPENFRRLFLSPAFRGPFVSIFLWTIAFAFFSVLSTFALGLLVAMAFNDPLMPGRKLIRSLLLIPYTIPGIIGVLIWKGLLNPHLGIISTTLDSLIGWSPPVFTDPLWAKIGILLVNLWLGYPYMMLICSGALQAIPEDIYDAAAVDGANRWQRFWNITLPLLLVSVGPLLIASFTFNFNNFGIIYAFNEGRPPMAGTTTPAGHTDILISYTYRIAFEGGRGSDYAYAAAITIVIFTIVAVITLFQYRFTRQWEEVSESV